LEARGFKLLQNAIGMFTDLDQCDSVTVPDRLHQIIQVSNREQLAQWLIPLQQGFNFSATVTDGFSEIFEQQGFGDRLPWRLLVGMVDRGLGQRSP
jgi:hypothetical protein